MDPLGRRPRDVAPVCPKCGYLMVAGSREPKTTAVPFPAAHRMRLPVWQCDRCGIARPRLDDELEAPSSPSQASAPSDGRGRAAGATPARTPKQRQARGNTGPDEEPGFGQGG